MRQDRQARHEALLRDGVRLMETSVVIATRDRPRLLRRALDSVSAQSFSHFEVIVVDDGSAPGAADENARLARGIGSHGAYAPLPRVDRGHGPSLARNHGVSQTAGKLIAFLDDDDEWIDPQYLARACRAMAVTPEAGLHYANQESIRPDGTRWPPPIWIEELQGIAASSGPAQPDGTYKVTPAQVLRCRSFPHLNATVVRRSLFDAIGGFDATLRYEEDRDFQLRAMDAAPVIVHDPATVARHFVPERGTASTTVGPEQRALDQLRLLDKAILTAARPEVRAYARRHKAYTLKAVARQRYQAGDLDTAAFYAREALAIGLNAKWLAWSAGLAFRRLRRRGTTSP